MTKLQKKIKDKGAKVPSRYKLFVVVRDKAPEYDPIKREMVSFDQKVTYHDDDLIKFTAFLDRKFPNWLHFVVYNNRVPKGQRGEELGKFSTDNRPNSRYIN